MLPNILGPSCVWMRAGLIRFWLCDRDFDCENCPLDAALRGPHASCHHDRATSGNGSPERFPRADRRTVTR